MIRTKRIPRSEAISSAKVYAVTARISHRSSGEGRSCLNLDVWFLFQERIHAENSELELYRLLSQSYPGLAVILISGRDRSVIQRGGFAGTTFLQKPLDADEVIRAVSVALAHKN